MALIPIEEEDDEDEVDEDEDLYVETVDDGDDLELGENMNWPTAFAYVAFFLVFAIIWHDCFGHH
jgi:hypothetical protein